MSTRVESPEEIAQRVMNSVKEDPRARATAERVVAEIRTSLGQTVVLDAANDSALGPKASPDAKSLMAYVEKKKGQYIQEGYTPAQAAVISITTILEPIRDAAIVANDNEMKEALRHVSATVVRELGNQPDGPDKGADIGRFTSGVKRGTAFAMRGRGGRT